jgi:hypothetical protein
MGVLAIILRSSSLGQALMRILAMAVRLSASASDVSNTAGCAAGNN